MSQAKGDRRERELVNALDEDGFAVMRAPASGSATERELPDALAGNGDVFYAIEAKSSSGDPIYIEEEQIDALLFFANNFGAVPVVGARFDYQDWYFLSPSGMYRTPSGNYRVKKDVAKENGITMEELQEQNPIADESNLPLDE